MSNRLTDFALGKSLDNLDAARQTLAAVTDRFAAFEATALNVHIDFPLFQRLALPIVSGHTKVPGIKIHDTRLVRLMEALLHGGTQIHGWRTAQLHRAILAAFALTPTTYTLTTLTQLRYDLRKMKAHGVIQRDGTRYAYRLDGRPNTVNDRTQVPRLVFRWLLKLIEGSQNGSALGMPQHNDQPCAEPRRRELDAADLRGSNDVSGNANDKQIAQTLVEHDLSGNSRV